MYAIQSWDIDYLLNKPCLISRLCKKRRFSCSSAGNSTVPHISIFSLIKQISFFSLIFCHIVTVGCCQRIIPEVIVLLPYQGKLCQSVSLMPAAPHPWNRILCSSLVFAFLSVHTDTLSSLSRHPRQLYPKFITSNPIKAFIYYIGRTFIFFWQMERNDHFSGTKGKNTPLQSCFLLCNRVCSLFYDA